jgi:hypothetical protein
MESSQPLVPGPFVLLRRTSFGHSLQRLVQQLAEGLRILYHCVVPDDGHEHHLNATAPHRLRVCWERRRRGDQHLRHAERLKPLLRRAKARRMLLFPGSDRRIWRLECAQPEQGCSRREYNARYGTRPLHENRRGRALETRHLLQPSVRAQGRATSPPPPGRGPWQALRDRGALWYSRAQMVDLAVPGVTIATPAVDKE